MSHISRLNTSIVNANITTLAKACIIMAQYEKAFQNVKMIDNNKLAFNLDGKHHTFTVEVVNGWLTIGGDFYYSDVKQEQMKEYIEQWYYTAASVMSAEALGAETINVNVDGDNVYVEAF